MIRLAPPALSLLLALVCGAVAVVLGDCLASAESAAPPTAVAVSRLAPYLSAKRARELGEAIDSAAAEHDLDPILIAAIAHRESSYLADVISGKRRGSRGEVGIMQIMPRGVALRYAPEGCDQRDLACSLATGCAYLAYLRDEGCPGSTWRWVSAYGRRRCPTEEEAQRGRGARRARDLYRRAGGRGW